eukprot:m.165531 g.165531  ORF g.165531 m.165531 type:complete len:1124 (+) comp16425_c0_seq6:464-3835(+)
MGLGKTVQISAFLDGMFASELIHTALIVMPLSVMANWKKELNFWAPDINVQMFHGTSKVTRNKALRSVIEDGGICLTTYGMTLSCTKDFNQNDHVWDYVILDEGHKIRNHTSQSAKAIREIETDNRVILSGTPIQNKLAELWALFDFVCFGTLLGTRRTFTSEFENKIVRGSDRNASNYEKLEAKHLAEKLRELIQPHFLRREKKTEFDNKPSKKTANESSVLAVQQIDMRAPDSSAEDTWQAADGVHKSTQLPRKDDLVVWVYLSKLQEKIYRHFLESERVSEILCSTKSPLAALTVMKKLCDHPRLLRNQQQYHVALGLREKEEGSSDGSDNEGGDEDDHSQGRDTYDAQIHESGLDADIMHAIFTPKMSGAELLNQSGKLRFCIQLLRQLKVEKHRVLIFSQSLKMLDMIATVLRENSLTFSRLDGSVGDVDGRQRLIDTFNGDDSIFCMLLTTQVGGVGLTLTGADRVIIFDPSWNPSVDAQAVDRAYRIGQTRRVVVYRLVTCGTIEEKIYRKQVFKDGLSRVATSEQNPYRYFSRDELVALFKLEDTSKSCTMEQLEQLHGKQTTYDEELLDHLEQLACEDLYGTSNHALLFSKASMDDAADHSETANAKNHAENIGARLRSECESTVPRRNKLERHIDTSERAPRFVLEGNDEDDEEEAVDVSRRSDDSVARMTSEQSPSPNASQSCFVHDQSGSSEPEATHVSQHPLDMSSMSQISNREDDDGEDDENVDTHADASQISESYPDRSQHDHEDSVTHYDDDAEEEEADVAQEQATTSDVQDKVKKRHGDDSDADYSDAVEAELDDHDGNSSADGDHRANVSEAADDDSDGNVSSWMERNHNPTSMMNQNDEENIDAENTCTDDEQEENAVDADLPSAFGDTMNEKASDSTSNTTAGLDDFESPVGSPARTTFEPSSTFLERYQGASMIVMDESFAGNLSGDEDENDRHSDQEADDEDDGNRSECAMSDDEEDFYTADEDAEESVADNTSISVDKTHTPQTSNLNTNKKESLQPFAHDNTIYPSPAAFVLSPQRSIKDSPVCPQHRSTKVRVHRCRCHVPDMEMLEYNMLTRMAQELQAMSNAHGALQMNLKALDICSDDLALHRSALHLAKTLKLE